MENFRYITEFWQSFKDVFRKPVLLLPFVYIFVLSTIFVFLMPATPIDYLGFMDPNYINLTLTIIGLGLLEGLISLIFSTMGLVGMRMQVNGEAVTHKSQVSGGFKIYWKVLLQRLILLVIALLPAAILYLIYYGLIDVNYTLRTVIGVIFLVAFIIYIIIISLYYLFSSAIIAYDGKSAMQSLKESYYFFKQNSAHTVLVFLTMILFGIIMIVIYGVLFFLMMLAFKMSQANVAIMSDILISFMMIPFMAAFILYIFKAYNNAGEQKVTVNSVEEKKSEKSMPIKNMLPDKKPQKSKKASADLKAKPAKPKK